MLACFPPVVDSATHTLVLGSLPGVASLAANRYYAHPRNQFWRLVSGAIDADLVTPAYEQRLQTLREHGIGLWDVVAEAQRDGSLDSSIRNHASNDLVMLIESLPQLTTIAFNGGTAARLGLKALQQHAPRYRILTLPSSSPAYTLAFDKKMAAWRDLREQPFR